MIYTKRHVLLPFGFFTHEWQTSLQRHLTSLVDWSAGSISVLSAVSAYRTLGLHEGCVQEGLSRVPGLEAESISVSKNLELHNREL